jgi:hypothetical protein
MKTIQLRIDPRVYEALGAMTLSAHGRRGQKTKLIQDILYSYVYSTRRVRPFELLDSPRFPPLLAQVDADLRRTDDGQLCRVDEFGLKIEVSQ